MPKFRVISTSGICLATCASGIASCRSAPSPSGGRPVNVREVIAKYGADVRAEFSPICARLGIRYPPRRIRILVFKRERSLELWGANQAGPFYRLARFPVLAASGVLGPKRKEGDLQVPEGFYRISHLNPQSRFHLSLKVNYPNRDDVANSKVARSEIGSDIFIHGNRVSIGCVAIGDPAIEKLFCLTAMARELDRGVIISPVDFRRVHGFQSTDPDAWVRNLYLRLDSALKQYPINGVQKRNLI